MEKKKTASNVLIRSQLLHGDHAPIEPGLAFDDVDTAHCVMSVWFNEKNADYDVRRELCLKDEISILRAIRDNKTVELPRMKVRGDEQFVHVMFECDDDPISVRVRRPDFEFAASKFPVRLLD